MDSAQPAPAWAALPWWPCTSSPRCCCACRVMDSRSRARAAAAPDWPCREEEHNLRRSRLRPFGLRERSRLVGRRAGRISMICLFGPGSARRPRLTLEEAKGRRGWPAGHEWRGGQRGRHQRLGEAAVPSWCASPPTGPLPLQACPLFPPPPHANSASAKETLLSILRFQSSISRLQQAARPSPLPAPPTTTCRLFLPVHQTCQQGSSL